MALFTNTDLIQNLWRPQRFAGGSDISALARLGSGIASAAKGNGMAAGMQAYGEGVASAEDPLFSMKKRLMHLSIKSQMTSAQDKLLQIENMQRQREGMKELHNAIATGDFDSDETYQSVLAIAAKYGVAEQAKPIIDRFEQAATIKGRLAERIIYNQGRTAGQRAISIGGGTSDVVTARNYVAGRAKLQLELIDLESLKRAGKETVYVEDNRFAIQDAIEAKRRQIAAWDDEHRPLWQNSDQYQAPPQSEDGDVVRDYDPLTGEY